MNQFNISNLSKKQAFYIITGLTAVVIVLILVQTQKYFIDLDELSLYTAEVTKKGATLSLLTESEKVEVGQNLTVEIKLNTHAESIDGVDIYSLNYDPTMLDVIDADLGQSGTQISSAGLMPVTVVNRVDEKAGLIQFAQVTTGGTTFKGKGKLATVVFKTLKTGEASLNFDFIPGNTADTNVAAYGIDKLKGAGGLVVKIEN